MNDGKEGGWNIGHATTAILSSSQPQSVPCPPRFSPSPPHSDHPCIPPSTPGQPAPLIIGRWLTNGSALKNLLFASGTQFRQFALAVWANLHKMPKAAFLNQGHSYHWWSFRWCPVLRLGLPGPCLKSTGLWVSSYSCQLFFCHNSKKRKW